MAQPQPMKLALNIAPIESVKAVITAYTETFESTDEIPAIRERYRETHFVRRFEENKVLIVPIRPDSPALNTPIKVDLASSPYLVGAL